jgi:hypothetical protein
VKEQKAGENRVKAGYAVEGNGQMVLMKAKGGKGELQKLDKKAHFSRRMSILNCPH